MKHRVITLFYDGTFYTFKWLKALLWAKEEIRKLGYIVEFSSMYEYLPIKGKENNFEKRVLSRKYDIVLIAHHHSGVGLGTIHKTKRLEIIQKLKEQCKMLIWMDTADSTGTTQFEVLPYVDLYFKKQLLINFEQYENPVWGGRVYCEYYHNKLQFGDSEIENQVYDVLDKQFRNKIRLSWNVGLGDLFGTKYRSYFVPKKYTAPEYILPNSYKNFDVHYRGSKWSSIAGYQRTLCRQALEKTTRVTHPDASAKVPHDEYIREIKGAKSVLSPFGWGEICTRDFEAFVYGATLLKPDVSHMITYPNWYIENETYVPIDWDFKNIEDVFKNLSDKKEEMHKIAVNGQSIFKKYLSDEYGKKEFAKHFVKGLDLDYSLFVE